MMTILNANNNTNNHANNNKDLSSSEKRSLVDHTEETLEPNKRSKTESPIVTQEDFSSKMIIQMAKSAIATLDSKLNFKNDKINKEHDILKEQQIMHESPLESLSNSISLPVTNPNSITSKNLSLLLSQLTSEIAKFDNMIALPLLKSILRVNWIYHSENDENFNKHYATFLTVLVSTIPSWWKDVAVKIMSDFTKTDDKSITSHHDTLKKLIAIAPTASNSLPDLIKSHFPNKTSPKAEINYYIRNILCVAEYYTVLTNHVWTLIFENIITLDVELQNQIDEVDDDDLPDALGLEDSDDENNSDNENDGMDNSDSEEDSNNVDSDSDDDLMTSDIEDCTKLNKEKLSKTQNGTISSNLSDADDDDDDEFNDEIQNSDDEYNLELESLSDLSKKLDNLINYLLHYLKSNLSIDSLESGSGLQTFNALTSIFRTMILPTQGTRATQYLLFYAAQQQPELIDAFIISLLEIVFSNGAGNANNNNNKSDSTISNVISSFSNGNTRGIPLNMKITACQYISSFVARGKELSDEQIVSIVTFIVKYCNAYMEEHEDEDDDYDNNENMNTGLSSRSNSNSKFTSKKESNPTKHALFYSLVQGLMYIVCFRKDSLREKNHELGNNAVNQDLSTSTSSTGWAAQIDRFFTRVIVSKYDPLRWCNETVVLIFSRVAQNEGLCYTWSVVERIKRERVGRTMPSSNPVNDNKNSRDSTPVTVTATSQSTNFTVSTLSTMRATQEFMDLVAVFPFDPLLLNKSRKIVKPFYVEWDNGNDEDDEDETGESD